MIMRKDTHILVVMALFCTTPTVARSHAFLDHASPRVGNTVIPAPKEVVLWFTQQLSRPSTRSRCGTSKAPVTAGKATVGGNRTQLRVPLKALPPGNYKVIWRVLSVDTHRTEGISPSASGRNVADEDIDQWPIR
jgi:methionine-rich copper-binding protein CopC